METGWPVAATERQNVVLIERPTRRRGLTGEGGDTSVRFESDGAADGAEDV
jgi:hypothetical protein